MRYVFIINPKAGNKDSSKNIMKQIESILNPLGAEYKCYITQRANHAREITELEASKGDEVSIFACGGDGTLNEVVSGAVGHKNAQIGVIPCGSGNDYIKLYGDKQSFTDISAQIEGKSHTVDLIKANDRYSINICSIGLDAKVCHHQIALKRIPFVSGKVSYFLAIIRTVMGRLATHLRINDIDNNNISEGEYVFALAACGRVYGGGYIGAPNAIPNDGLMDITLCSKVSHISIPSILSKYKAGQHDEISEYITSFRSRKIHIKAKKKLPINTDGEVIYSDEITFESLPHAVNFIIPKGCFFNFEEKEIATAQM